MKLILLTSIALGLVMTGPSLADKASRQEHKAERQEKKAERQERKAERKAENGEHKGMGKFDKNHDGVMSSEERVAKYNSVPGWMHDRPDLANVDPAKLSPTVATILSIKGQGGGPDSANHGQHNGAASDR